jgi:hypothetical protein
MEEKCMVKIQAKASLQTTDSSSQAIDALMNAPYILVEFILVQQYFKFTEYVKIHNT